MNTYINPIFIHGGLPFDYLYMYELSYHTYSTEN